MGLDIGIISINYLERPTGIAYDFAWEMAEEASAHGYMHGEGNNWAAFTQRRVLRLLDRFVRSHGLSDSDKAEILTWLQSLPWDGWRDNLLPDDNSEESGLIELHFNC
jgi:hypothetical protein